MNFSILNRYDRANQMSSTKTFQSADSLKEIQYPLHAAIKLNDIQRIQFMLDHTKDVDLQDYTGATPLMLAVTLGQLDTVRALVRLGANADLADHQQWTPLMIAVKNNYLSIAEILIAEGKADPSLQDKFGKRAIERAYSIEVINLLKDAEEKLEKLYTKKEQSFLPQYSNKKRFCQNRKTKSEFQQTLKLEADYITEKNERFSSELNSKRTPRFDENKSWKNQMIYQGLKRKYQQQTLFTESVNEGDPSHTFQEKCQNKPVDQSLAARKGGHAKSWDLGKENTKLETNNAKKASLNYSNQANALRYAGTTNSKSPNQWKKVNIIRQPFSSTKAKCSSDDCSTSSTNNSTLNLMNLSKKSLNSTAQKGIIIKNRRPIFFEESNTNPSYRSRDFENAGLCSIKHSSSINSPLISHRRQPVRCYTLNEEEYKLDENILECQDSKPLELEDLKSSINNILKEKLVNVNDKISNEIQNIVKQSVLEAKNSIEKKIETLIGTLVESGEEEEQLTTSLIKRPKSPFHRKNASVGAWPEPQSPSFKVLNTNSTKLTIAPREQQNTDYLGNRLIMKSKHDPPFQVSNEYIPKVSRNNNRHIKSKSMAFTNKKVFLNTKQDFQNSNVSSSIMPSAEDGRSFELILTQRDERSVTIASIANNSCFNTEMCSAQHLGNKHDNKRHSSGEASNEKSQSVDSLSNVDSEKKLDYLEHMNNFRGPAGWKYKFQGGSLFSTEEMDDPMANFGESAPLETDRSDNKPFIGSAQQYTRGNIISKIESRVLKKIGNEGRISYIPPDSAAPSPQEHSLLSGLMEPEQRHPETDDQRFFFNISGKRSQASTESYFPAQKKPGKADDSLEVSRTCVHEDNDVSFIIKQE